MTGAVSATLSVVALLIVGFYYFAGQVEGRIQMTLFAAAASMFGVFTTIAVVAWDLLGRIVAVAQSLSDSFNALG